ncbi:hypothetical protein V7201_02900 [Bacillus sp. JJ1122]
MNSNFFFRNQKSRIPANPAQLVDIDTDHRSVIETLLIGVEGAQTPAGAAGQVRPRRSEATGGSGASPAESEAPGTEINRLVL